MQFGRQPPTFRRGASAILLSYMSHFPILKMEVQGLYMRVVLPHGPSTHKIVSLTATIEKPLNPTWINLFWKAFRKCILFYKSIASFKNVKFRTRTDTIWAHNLWKTCEEHFMPFLRYTFHWRGATQTLPIAASWLLNWMSRDKFQFPKFLLKCK
jgi:hypothetical protein